MEFDELMANEDGMELDEHYCDNGGHYHPECAPDPTDIVDAYNDRIASMFEYFKKNPEELLMQQTLAGLREQFKQLERKVLERKIFSALEEVEYCISNRIDKIIERIDLIETNLCDHLFPKLPDDYDTQEQIEEYEALGEYAKDWCGFEPISLEDEPQEFIPDEYIRYNEELGTNFWKIDSWENDEAKVEQTVELPDGKELKFYFDTPEQAFMFKEAWGA